MKPLNLSEQLRSNPYPDGASCWAVPLIINPQSLPILLWAAARTAATVSLSVTEDGIRTKEHMILPSWRIRL